MTQPPRGTVTFLFTDLKASTRLWEEHTDAMHTALARHDELMRDAIESHRGYVVKTTGDGSHGAFSNASDALDAAIAIQRALGVEEWGETGALIVRVGLHTGESELRDGDYYGPSVNRAARIMDAGHGGQILLSRATADLVRDHLADAVTLVDLGEHRLRDLSRVEQIFEVHAPGLAVGVPAAPDRADVGREPAGGTRRVRGTRGGARGARGRVARTPPRHARRRGWCGQDPPRGAVNARRAPIPSTRVRGWWSSRASATKTCSTTPSPVRSVSNNDRV